MLPEETNALKLVLEKAIADEALLSEARIYYARAFESIKTIKHKTFGEGRVESFDGSVWAVHFPKLGETKKLGLYVSLLNGFIRCGYDGFTENVEKYRELMKKEHLILSNLKRSIEQMQPYMEYFI